jgi:hypothetical protein
MRTSDRRIRLAAAIVTAVLAVVAVAGPTAGAPRPQAVTIDSTMQILLPDQPNVGDFTRTSGSELICDQGSVADTRYVWGSPLFGPNPTGAQLQVDKTFDCGDGLIFFRLQIQGVAANEVFTWVVLGGTGAYTGLRGGGEGWTVPSDPWNGTVLNHYSGYLVR